MPSGQYRAREARFARLAFDICDGGHNVFARIAGPLQTSERMMSSDERALSAIDRQAHANAAVDGDEIERRHLGACSAKLAMEVGRGLRIDDPGLRTSAR